MTLLLSPERSGSKAAQELRRQSGGTVEERYFRLELELGLDSPVATGARVGSRG
jgi:hypothetical protein